MTEQRAVRRLRGAAALTLLGLAFMLWSLVAPTALPVVLAMSVGQGVGTLAFALYGWVVVAELRAGQAARKQAAAAQEAAAAPTPPADERGGAP